MSDSNFEEDDARGIERRKGGREEVLAEREKTDGEKFTRVYMMFGTIE